MSDDEQEPMTNTMLGGGGVKAKISRETPFFEYITSLTQNEKCDILNMIQYGGLTILPFLILLRVMNEYVPTENPYKNTSEIIIEVVLELIVILVAFFFIHKLVLYIPTYSKMEYDHISLLSGILPLMFVLLSLDTKLREKLNILFERLLVAIGLKKEGMENKKTENTNTTISQTGSNTQLPSAPQIDDRVLGGVIPQRGEVSQMMPQGGDVSTDSNEMMNIQEPMAANSVLGASPF